MMYIKRLQINRNTHRGINFLNPFNIKIITQEETGSAQRVNKILIVNISGRGRFGKK